MNKMDCNCLVGHWPFRKLRESGIEAVKAKYGECGITHGFVANMDSIFYNDPLEGEDALSASLKDSTYHHVMSINPMLPCFEEDIDLCIKKYGIKAVRIYPGYHNYSLTNNKNIDKLCTILAREELTLFITARMEDERLNYLMKPLTPEEFNLFGFISLKPECKVLMLTVRLGEIMQNTKLLCSDSRVWVDTSGLKDKAFTVENVCSEIGPDKLVYGSQYPLFSLRATLYLVEREGLPDELKHRILWDNAQAMLTKK